MLMMFTEGHKTNGKVIATMIGDTVVLNTVGKVSVPIKV
jgi:hypothetical protein